MGTPVFGDSEQCVARAGQGWAELGGWALGASAAASPSRCADCWSTVLATLDRQGGGWLARRGTAIGASWWQGGKEGPCCQRPGDEAFRSLVIDVSIGIRLEKQ